MDTEPNAPTSRPPGALTLTAYAAHRGCAKSSVSDAIKAGRLAQSVGRDSRGPYILDAALADREWLAHTDYTDAPSSVIARLPDTSPRPPMASEATPVARVALADIRPAPGCACRRERPSHLPPKTLAAMDAESAGYAQELYGKCMDAPGLDESDREELAGIFYMWVHQNAPRVANPFPQPIWWNWDATPTR